MTEEFDPFEQIIEKPKTPVTKIMLISLLIFVAVIAFFIIKKNTVIIPEGNIGVIFFDVNHHEILDEGLHHINRKGNSVKLFDEKPQSFETNVKLGNESLEEIMFKVKVDYKVTYDYFVGFFIRFKSMDKVNTFIHGKLITEVRNFFGEILPDEFLSNTNGINEKLQKYIEEKTEQIIVCQKFDSEEVYKISMCEVFDKNEIQIPTDCEKLSTKIDGISKDVFLLEDSGFISKIGFYDDVFVILDVQIKDMTTEIPHKKGNE